MLHIFIDLVKLAKKGELAFGGLFFTPGFTAHADHAALALTGVAGKKIVLAQKGFVL